MPKTWKQIKEEIESLGITDDTELEYIDIGDTYDFQIEMDNDSIRGVFS